MSVGGLVLVANRHQPQSGRSVPLPNQAHRLGLLRLADAMPTGIANCDLTRASTTQWCRQRRTLKLVHFAACEKLGESQFGDNSTYIKG